MSHFYGTLNGSRGQATRCGTANSGLQTIAAGWTGAIRVQLYTDENDQNCFRVEIGAWQGSGGDSQIIAEGPLDPMVKFRAPCTVQAITDDQCFEVHDIVPHIDLHPRYQE